MLWGRGGGVWECRKKMKGKQTQTAVDQLATKQQGGIMKHKITFKKQVQETPTRRNKWKTLGKNWGRIV